MVQAVYAGGSHVGAGLGIRRGGNRLDQLPGVRVAEVETVQALRDDDGLAAIRGEVQVVRVGHRDRWAWLAGPGGDRCEGVALGVVGVEGPEVPGGCRV